MRPTLSKPRTCVCIRTSLAMKLASTPKADRPQCAIVPLEVPERPSPRREAARAAVPQAGQQPLAMRRNAWVLVQSHGGST